MPIKTKEKIINKCIFCEKDLSKEKFREDYVLLPWRNDSAEPESFNKIAKCSHPKCFREFIELNFEDIKKILLSLIGE